MGMVLNHIAAVVLLSGPFFWIGLWMAIDPGGVAWIPEQIVRAFRRVLNGSAGPASEAIVEPEDVAFSVRYRRAVRFAGIALLLFAMSV